MMLVMQKPNTWKSLGSAVRNVVAKLTVSDGGIESGERRSARRSGVDTREGQRAGEGARGVNAETQKCFLFGGGAHSAVANPLIAPRETRFMVAA